MRNPTKRNRNIGTKKQGHNQNNKLVIPYPAAEMKTFFERLTKYTIVTRMINGHTFRFIIEQTRTNSFHACTIPDVEKIIAEIPKEYYGELELIIFRQPTRKEELINSVWGRLIYSYEFENDYFPAIIIEAINLENTFKWDKKLSIDHQRELERLKNDGHNIKTEKRFYTMKYELKKVRATQLYRTLIHEFGHYIHYLTIVKKPLLKLKAILDLLDAKINNDDTSDTNPLFNEWETLFDKYAIEVEKQEKIYFAIPTQEKEVFAHNYADLLKKELEDKNIIPFTRILKEEQFIQDGLNLSDFEKANSSKK